MNVMWLDQLGTAPEALTRRQRWFFAIASVVVALTRLFAVSRTLWDWDETLFSHSLLDYDVVHHHPHPPGFPLFVGLARLIHLVVASEFRSLQIITVCGAMLLFPLTVFLGRELRLSFSTAMVAAFLLAFFPNVWFFGGTAFSDVASLALVVLACALLLRGCRDRNAYFFGAFVLALAAGFRPQNLVVGCFPALLSSWFRWRVTRSLAQPLAGAAIGAVTLFATYAGAALATGDWREYLAAVRHHSAYIAKVDSFRNPARPPLHKMFDDFFIRPYRMREINTTVSLFAAIGVIAAFFRRRTPLLLALAAFGPFCLLGWLMLDRHSTSRFSIGWAPLIAICAAEGVRRAARGVAALTRRQRSEAIATAVVTTALVGLMISWTFPALKVVRRKVSPPMQAIAWIHANVPAGSTIYFDGTVEPFVNLMLRDYRTERFDGSAPDVAGQRGWVFREGVSSHDGGHNFTFQRRTLWNLARRRYFELSVAPVDTSMRFAAGWHGAESSDTHMYRWMTQSGVVLLGPTATAGRIVMRGYVPLDALPEPPEITVRLNGVVLGKFVASSANVERSFVIGPLPAESNELRIETSRIVNPRKEGLGDDARDLGFRLDSLAWRAEETAP
jgi:hypothetical protein